MKANGLVLWAALALPLSSVSAADGTVVLSDYNQPVALAFESDSAVEPVAFHSHSGHGGDGFWYVSTEFLFMDVRAETGGRITMSFDDNTTVGTEISFLGGEGLDDFAFAPRLVLGRQLCEKWAVAARYFHLTDHEAISPPLTPGTTPLPTFGTYAQRSKTEMYTIDLEAIRSFNPGKTKIDASFGARQASLDNDSAISAFGVITSGNFVNLNLANGCAFDGTGVVSGLMIRRQIGDSPLSLFLGGRASQMWGHSDSYGSSAGAVASSPSAPLVGAATVTRNNSESDLELYELSLGGQLDFALRDLPCNVFVRAAFEYQEWDINGPPTGGAGFGGTIGDLTTNSFSSAGLGDTELVGLALATGFTW